MEFILTSEGLAVLMSALLAVSEVIALTPLKSNSVFQLVWGILKKLGGKNEPLQKKN